MGKGHGSGGRTNFENMSHAEMIEMVKSGKPEQLIDRGHHLVKAHKDMAGIADDLKTYMDRVHWDSDSGDAFRSWGHAVAKSIHSLGDYSKTVGTYMLSAGETLAGVKKAMPEVPEDALKQLGDEAPGSKLLVNQGEANRAVPGGIHVGVTNLKTVNAYNKVENARQEAIKQMDRLSSHYATAADSISRQEEPRFPALPAELAPPSDPFETTERAYAPSGKGADGVISAHGESGEQVLEEHAESVPHRKSVASGSLAPEGSTDLDSVQAPPGPSDTTTGDAPPSPVTTGPSSGGGPHGVAPPPPVPNFISPVGPQGGGGGGGGSPSGRYGIFGGGREPVAPPRTPAGGQDIVGGKPGPSQQETGRIPKGTVVGEEPQQQSMMRRPPMMGGIGVGHGGGQPGRGAASRRLASQAGGVVGGPRSTGERQEFTPGGSGLTRAEDKRRPLTAPGVPDEGARCGERPDYLVEDGDTWDPGRDDVAPPVIE